MAWQTVKPGSWPVLVQSPALSGGRARRISRVVFHFASWMSDFATQRLAMDESQVRPNDVTDLRLQNAMLAVARERFVPAHLQAVASMEGCVDVQGGRFLLDARCFAKLVQLAGIRAGDAVLDVGCSSGYSSSVLSRLAAGVIALEEDPHLVGLARENLRGIANVRVVQGVLSAGHGPLAPYDVIFVNGAVGVRPDSLLAQLKDGGRLVCIGAFQSAGRASLYVRAEGVFSEREAFEAQVPLLPGFKKVPGFVF